jgi:CheY-like chemotaxis protein
VRAAVAAGARWAAILVAEAGTPGWRLRHVAPALHDDRTCALRPLLRSVDRVALMRGAARGRSRTILSRLHQGQKNEAVLATNWPEASIPSIAAAAGVLTTAAAFAWAADGTADEIRALRCALDAAARNEHALGVVARQAASLAHDFNNALTSILGFSEWLLGEHDIARRAETQLTHIHQSAIAAADVVSRLQALVQPYRTLGSAPARPATDAPRAPLGSAPAAVRPASGAPLSVLVVDDEPEVGESVARMLRALHHDVTAVTSGEAALKAVVSRRYDIVLTDLSMPKMSGLEVARRIGALASGARVILMTGWGAEEETEPADGVSLVLGKPVTLASLREALTAVLGRAA